MVRPSLVAGACLVIGQSAQKILEGFIPYIPGEE